MKINANLSDPENSSGISLQPTKWNKKFFFFLMTILLAVSLVILRSSSSANSPKESNEQALPTCCKKVKEKCPEPKKAVPADLMLESLSRQLITISAF